MSEGYNGWANYETWSVSLILSNDQYLDEEHRRIMGEAARAEDDKEMRGIRAADALKEWVEEQLEPIEESINNAGDMGMLVTQLLSAAMSEVDWLEIANNYLADEPVEEEAEEE